MVWDGLQQTPVAFLAFAQPVGARVHPPAQEHARPQEQDQPSSQKAHPPAQPIGHLPGLRCSQPTFQRLMVGRIRVGFPLFQVGIHGSQQVDLAALEHLQALRPLAGDVLDAPALFRGDRLEQVDDQANGLASAVDGHQRRVLIRSHLEQSIGRRRGDKDGTREKQDEDPECGSFHVAPLPANRP